MTRREEIVSGQRRPSSYINFISSPMVYLHKTLLSTSQRHSRDIQLQDVFVGTMDLAQPLILLPCNMHHMMIAQRAAHGQTAMDIMVPDSDRMPNFSINKPWSGDKLLHYSALDTSSAEPLKAIL